MRTIVVTLCVLASTPQPHDVNIDALRASVPTVHAGGETGAGFVVDRRLLLTAEHVVDGQSNVVVDFDGRLVDGTVTRQSKALDVAEIELRDDAAVQALPIATAEPTIGTRVFAVGSPLGTQAVSEGIVSGKPTQDGFPMLQTDAALNGGNSGGPLIDTNGQVVGLVVSKVNGAEGIGLAVAASSLRRFLSDPSFPGADAERAASDRAAAPGGFVDSTLLVVAALSIVALAVLGRYLMSRRSASDELEVRLGPVHDVPNGGTNADS